MDDDEDDFSRLDFGFLLISFKKMFFQNLKSAGVGFYSTFETSFVIGSLNYLLNCSLWYATYPLGCSGHFLVVFCQVS